MKDIIDCLPHTITLKTLTDEIGGFHIEKRVSDRHVKIAQWLLDNATLENFGYAAAIYSVKLADQKIAIKAGYIFLAEAKTQDAVAMTLKAAPKVYSYLRDLELDQEHSRKLCPFHGPLNRRKGQWKKEDAPCFCRYPKDILIMPFCDRNVEQDEFTPAVVQKLNTQVGKILNIARRYSGLTEIKTIMWLDKCMVFVDFGDPVELDDLNLVNPRHSKDD